MPRVFLLDRHTYLAGDAGSAEGLHAGCVNRHPNIVNGQADRLCWTDLLDLSG
jgi:hypothetical protein